MDAPRQHVQRVNTLTSRETHVARGVPCSGYCNTHPVVRLAVSTQRVKRVFMRLTMYMQCKKNMLYALRQPHAMWGPCNTRNNVHTRYPLAICEAIILYTDSLSLKTTYSQNILFSKHGHIGRSLSAPLHDSFHEPAIFVAPLPHAA